MDTVKCPEIRFGGFGGEWENQSFGDCFKNLPNNTLSRADLNYQMGLAKNIHYGDVLIKFGEILDVRNSLLPFITNDELSNKLKHACLKDGDIIIADAAEDNMVGKCTELFNIDEQLVTAGLHTIAIRPTLSFASKYLGYYLNSSAFHDQLLVLMQGTKVLSISKTAIQNTNVTFPKSAEEQTAIGNFFQQLDQSIVLQQQKYTQTQNLKKAMLEKMFPKAGSKQPEIRLKGFGGDWEEFKLGQIYGFNYGEFNTNPSNGGQYQVYGANGIIGGYTSYNAESSAVIGHMGEYAGSVLWAEGKHFVTYNGTIAKPKKSDFNSLFGYFALVKMNLKKVCGGSGQPFLSYDALERLDVLFPTEKEQTAIGQFFKQLDDTLALQQQQLQTLKNLKQAFLGKMFV